MMYFSSMYNDRLLRKWNEWCILYEYRIVMRVMCGQEWIKLAIYIYDEQNTTVRYIIPEKRGIELKLSKYFYTEHFFHKEYPQVDFSTSISH